MKGDFTRDTFRPEKHYEAVLMQQGRVQLDADWNEQASIVAHRLAAMMQDLVGSSGGPAENAAFRIRPIKAIEGDFQLSAGRYYVDGILCELAEPVRFSRQPHRDVNRTTDAFNEGQGHERPYLIYLDVWRRHVSSQEDDRLREPALGGPDTATRAQTVWQVRATPIDDWDPDKPCESARQQFTRLARTGVAELSARVVPADPNTPPCIVPSSAGYRGLENQLYRIEIHDGGNPGEATFKWSRENGSQQSRIIQNALLADGSSDPARLEIMPATSMELWSVGSLVELIHESDEWEFRPGPLAEIADERGATVVLRAFGERPFPPGTVRSQDNPRLRRWDGFGVIPSTPSGNGEFLILENGIEIRFHLSAGARFETGDYWLIPARTATPDLATGGIDWPEEENQPASLPPRGIERHLAPLAFLTLDQKKKLTSVADLRNLWLVATHGGYDPSAVRVNSLEWNDGDHTPLTNHARVTRSILEAGLTIRCSQPVKEESIRDPVRTNGSIVRGSPTCFVTAELPSVNGTQLEGYLPFVLHGSVGLVEQGKGIRWIPDPAAIDRVARSLIGSGLDGVLLRLTLKGNFILARTSSIVRHCHANGYLDGDSFATLDNMAPGLLLPSGDGRRGGDFEMWFWLSDSPQAPVLEPLGNVKAFQGTTVVFRARVLAGTQPIEFHWKRDNSDLHQVRSNVLTLRSVSFQDAGEYEVEARNAEGRATAKGTLGILSPIPVVGAGGLGGGEQKVVDFDLDPGVQVQNPEGRPLVGRRYSVQLYAGQGESQMEAMGRAVHFGRNGRWIRGEHDLVDLREAFQGLGPMDLLFLQVRAWDSGEDGEFSTFESAQVRGSSIVISAFLSAGGTTGSPAEVPQRLSGVPGFRLEVAGP